MKKLIILLAFALPLSMMAQKAPVAVTKAFAAKFPNVKKVDFDKEKSGEYEAEFKVNGVEMSANFTATGEWVETETEIPVAQLPAAVVTAIKKGHPNAKTVGAAKIETAKGMKYEADLKEGMKKSEVLYDASGNLVK